MSLGFTASEFSSGEFQTLKHAAKIKLLLLVCVLAHRSAIVNFACNMNQTSNSTVQQALLAKTPQCQQALPKTSQTHTHAHTSSDAFLVTQSQWSVLCPKILILSRKQAPLKPQTMVAQRSLTSPHCQLKKQEGQKFRVQIVQCDQDRSEIGLIIH